MAAYSIPQSKHTSQQNFCIRKGLSCASCASFSIKVSLQFTLSAENPSLGICFSQGNDLIWGGYRARNGPLDMKFLTVHIGDRWLASSHKNLVTVQFFEHLQC